jgi:hypothetical protein
VHQVRHPTRAEARLDIVDWIEGFYNRERLHSSLGYRTPPHGCVDWRTGNRGRVTTRAPGISRQKSVLPSTVTGGAQQPPARPARQEPGKEHGFRQSGYVDCVDGIRWTAVEDILDDVQNNKGFGPSDSKHMTKVRMRKGHGKDLPHLFLRETS